jgi:hypothetical protein
MSVNDNQQQPTAAPDLELAVNTGLKLLQSPDVSTPNAWTSGLYILERFLEAVRDQRLIVSTPPPPTEVQQEQPPQPQPPQPPAKKKAKNSSANTTERKPGATH